MQITVLIKNTNKKGAERWITLPTTEKVIYENLEEICINDNDTYLVANFKSKLDLDIIGYEDIYYLNELVSKLNTCGATNKEIQAISEAYSTDLEEILRKAQRGQYKFYPDKSLRVLAQELSNTCKYYKYYSDEQIVDELCNLGYEETSTGVIQFLES